MKTSKGLFLLIGVLLVPLLASAANPDCPAYDRKAWKHWVDEDKDCQNARHEVLIAESGCQRDKGCRVVSGSWYDSYSGRTITDASKLDIDHMLPLKETNESGGYVWDAYRKRDYANDLNDPNTLIAVDRGSTDKREPQIRRNGYRQIRIIRKHMRDRGWP